MMGLEFAIELNSSELLLGRSRVYQVGVLYHCVYHFPTVSIMFIISQQLRNDKHNDAIHQLDKLHSFQAIALSCLAQWLEYSVYN